MAYREDLNCQECLKRKVKSPMDMKLKKFLAAVGLIATYCGVIAADIEVGLYFYKHYGVGATWLWCLPVSFFIVAVSIAFVAIYVDFDE